MRHELPITYGDHPEVAIVTSKGVIVVELFPDEAPYNVDNFLYLVDRGYYDNQQLFRVIQNFVIQGGDPTNGGGDGGSSKVEGWALFENTLPTSAEF